MEENADDKMRNARSAGERVMRNRVMRNRERWLREDTEGRKREVTIDLVLRTRARRRRDKANGPGDCIVGEMLFELLLEVVARGHRFPTILANVQHRSRGDLKRAFVGSTLSLSCRY